MKTYLMNVIKRRSTYLLVGTAVLDALALILYALYGTSIFIPKLSAAEIAVLIAGMVWPFAAALMPWKIACVVQYALNLTACFEYLSSQASFIANVFVGIDGTSFPAAFYIIIVCTLGAAVMSLLAMMFLKEGNGAEGGKA